MADAMTLSSDLSSQYREHFESQLLTYAVQATRKAEFGQKAPLPKGVGSKQISFFKYGAPSDTQIADLTDASADETLAAQCMHQLMCLAQVVIPLIPVFANCLLLK